MFSVQKPDQTDKDFRDEVAKKVDRLGRMLETAGWKEFEAYVRNEAERALSEVGSATTSDMAMKAGTAYHTLTRLINLPRKEYEEGVKFLQSV